MTTINLGPASIEPQIENGMLHSLGVPRIGSIPLRGSTAIVSDAGNQRVIESPLQ